MLFDAPFLFKFNATFYFQSLCSVREQSRFSRFSNAALYISNKVRTHEISFQKCCLRFFSFFFHFVWYVSLVFVEYFITKHMPNIWTVHLLLTLLCSVITFRNVYQQFFDKLKQIKIERFSATLSLAMN